MKKLERTWRINGAEQVVQFEPLARLLDVLRDALSLMSCKEGCGEGECGACTVLLNGEPHVSCLVSAAQVDDGVEILSAEGLGALAGGRALQEAFNEGGAVQCGYCTPGMLLGGYSLLSKQQAIDEAQIREGLAGNLCRCTGYDKIVSAVQSAARKPAKGASS